MGVMIGTRWRQTLVLLVPGILAFLLAGLSIADMFLPKPYDGVVLEADAPGRLVVRQVVAGSGADTAGIRPGDVIVGIDRDVLDSPANAAEILNRHSIGDRVPYLVRSRGQLREVPVQMGRRRIGGTMYLVACLLGFSFFFVGLFVLIRQPRLPATRVFFMMCVLFLLFLVCRLRPASYSWVDSFVLTTGTLALLFLPATFLHFFMIFPRPIWEWRRDPLALTAGTFARKGLLLPLLYLLPAAVYIGAVTRAHMQNTELALISGAPAANWWVMVVYMLFGLGALAISSRWLPDQRQRRGAGLVFLGTVFGVVPFLVLSVAFPSFLNTERYLFYGVIPLVLVPLTFAYAIIRFQLLDIRVILRKSLMYTITTALVTAAYALGIASFNWLFRGTQLAAAPYFPLVFALAIVLLFEPLRHRLQEPVNKFFFRERSRLQLAMEEMGEAFTAQVDLTLVVRELVSRLPELLGLRFAALYLQRSSDLERVAGPSALPERLPEMPLLNDFLARRGGLVRVEQLAPLEMLSPEVESLSRRLGESGVEVIGTLTSPRRFLGLVLLSGTAGQITLEWEDLRLVRGLFQQASIALETGTLLEERTRQAELERELKIAAQIQASLLPRQLEVATGWRVAAACRPAREVGGDFYTQLPGLHGGARALVYGDVSGKSIPGALLMMAAHEVLHALAIAHSDPAELFDLANQRLHTLRHSSNVLSRGSFVALGYLACAPEGGSLRYSVAGQPPPLKRYADGRVEELAMPRHRIPLGAFPQGGYRVLETPMEKGDVVLAYSDGVLESMSPSGEFFGVERLIRVLEACSDVPDEIVPRVLEAVSSFAEGGAAYDDITVLAVSCCSSAGGCEVGNETCTVEDT
jgi:serine phosphatase RsbU (regulator of sigma subunit)